MSFTNDTTSSLTDRYQTTIPSEVRKALQLGKRDKIVYTPQTDGSINIRRAESGDPVLDGFLSFLASDMSSNPEQIASLPHSLAKRIDTITQGVQIDLDAPLLDEDE